MCGGTREDTRQMILKKTNQMNDISVIDATIEDITQYGVCGYKSLKKPGLPEKVNWLQHRFKEGLRIKILHSEIGGTQGMIEYIPGKYCWRPIHAEDYMVIHCIFVGFKKIYKNKGFATQLLTDCEENAKTLGLKGVAAITRKGSFMVGKELFTKNGYIVSDRTKPDFELVVKKFSTNSPEPKFRNNSHKYNKGLTLIRADQCPYTVKNVNEICEAAKKDFGQNVKVISLQSYQEAQDSPCPFGSFCLIYNGEILAYHPISKGRFVNIMKKLHV